RIAILESPGQRQGDEPLPAYLSRLMGSLPGETGAQRRQRIEGYLEEIGQAASATQSLRRLPVLRETNAENRRLWMRIVRATSALPRRLAHARALWRKAIDPGQAQRGGPSPVSALSGEMYQLVFAILTARDDLRDARP